jgi:hypothetical protein
MPGLEFAVRFGTRIRRLLDAFAPTLGESPVLLVQLSTPAGELRWRGELSESGVERLAAVLGDEPEPMPIRQPRPVRHLRSVS